MLKKTIFLFFLVGIMPGIYAMSEKEFFSKCSNMALIQQNFPAIPDNCAKRLIKNVNLLQEAQRDPSEFRCEKMPLDIRKECESNLVELETIGYKELADTMRTIAGEVSNNVHAALLRPEHFARWKEGISRAKGLNEQVDKELERTEKLIALAQRLTEIKKALSYSAGKVFGEELARADEKNRARLYFEKMAYNSSLNKERKDLVEQVKKLS